MSAVSSSFFVCKLGRWTLVVDLNQGFKYDQKCMQAINHLQSQEHRDLPQPRVCVCVFACFLR